MLECGSSQRTVANVFGVSQNVISRTRNRFQTSGSATQRHDGGRQRATTQRQGRFLVVQARRHPFVNATGHNIMSTGLITIGILYSSPMSQGTVLTLQIDVLECGEDVVSNFKMATSMKMAATVDAP